MKSKTLNNLHRLTRLNYESKTEINNRERSEIIKLADLVKPLLKVKVFGKLDGEISGLSYDSRFTKPGQLFTCIKGTKDDGHKYLEDVLSKGVSAVVAQYDCLSSEQKKLLTQIDIPVILVTDSRKAFAILASKYYNYPGDSLRVTGVTGTKGKTTTVNLIDKLLSEGKEVKTGMIGTINARIDDQEEKQPTTTPGPLELNELLGRIENSGASHVTLEVSSHAISQLRIAGVDLDIAVYTNLAPEHLDYHTDMDEYKRTKGRIFSFQGLKPEKNDKPKLAVINLDDKYASYMLEQPAVQVLTHGFDENAHVKGKIINTAETFTELKITSPWGNFTVKTPLIGKFNCYNLLAAITVALFEGIPASKIQTILEQPINIPGRFERIDLGQEFTVVVDFAHTTDSLQEVLQSLRQMVSGKIGVVFGCGGERDKSKRPKMGRAASDLGDKIFITSDNPRAEDPQKIVQDILSGCDVNNNEKIQIELDRAQAIEKSLNWAREGDAVLIAGKGHEATQEINGKVINFDDREIAREKLKKMGY
ncbi:UDP-N-acetylmuramoyl-L-alanyl-D-glutamate--2,6-diaminopimelate ligase [Natranaerobius thermophilus]|uniref:UDP-N-acetylmuramoyl-L-alanyl-D-glutamate--2,6-diaminopimelate ligase n=1 Tax=Natranaerobius thermophilus (strain ATCC BAA-1301 / DSM 18059 / JW/NM-WN-LF) TaxID=457570 RepID=B2A2G7_NATTJ|nr:UDP-N-acetylmuramoyl-L-alanyl-D-glutamate--2,6-diaminopimelate ligase [Natranaerobius thermophilus]ACB84882.1 UDP-N-acetylmuramyl-tripeptide synthetase [Natranaerobius thermophilus JW/NM-WN-LF]